MRAVDIIVTEIEKQELSQKKAAELCGMSRQRLWDVLEKRNPRFQTMQKIMSGFGYKVALMDLKTGAMLPEREAELFSEKCAEENVPYDSIVEILATVGISVVLTK